MIADVAIAITYAATTSYRFKLSLDAVEDPIYYWNDASCGWSYRVVSPPQRSLLSGGARMRGGRIQVQNPDFVKRAGRCVGSVGRSYKIGRRHEPSCDHMRQMA